MTKLKPCPFCGCEPQIFDTGNICPEVFYRVLCPKNCCAQSEFFRSKLDAIAKWNERFVDGETSDGYHTFNELYHHRAVLFSVIVASHPELCWKSKRHYDGSMFDGMFIVGIKTPEGQATYHYDLDPYWDMFECQEIEYAPEWDGHTAAQAIERIEKLRSSFV